MLWLGYVPFKEIGKLKKSQDELTKRIQGGISEIEKIRQEIADGDDFKKFVPSKGYNEVYPDDKSHYHWNEYWRDYYRDYHIAYKLRILSKKAPVLLNAFLNAFSSYDWEKTRAYMESVNWTWHDSKTSPTIEDLKYCVISLLPENDFTYTDSGISSGGFEVILGYGEDKAVCEIKFSNQY